MADYGSDFHCVNDVDYALSTVSGTRALAEAVMRRIITPVNGLFYDLTYGDSIATGVGVSYRTFGDLQSRAEDEAMKDERVADAQATVTLVPETEILTVSVTVTPVEGEPFDMTFNIADKTSAQMVEAFTLTERAI